MTEPTFDADGYPTDETLRVIAEWPLTSGWGYADLLGYVKRAWKDGTLLCSRIRISLDEDTSEPLEEPIMRYFLSTGGWSGNESIVTALMRNQLFWACCWMESSRGGHYVFEVRELK